MNFAGGSVLGRVITGLPSFSVTVGRPAGGLIALPVGPPRTVSTMSMTKIKVSPTFTSMLELPPWES